MIHEFKVSNFLSFKEEKTLSFEATSDKLYRDLYCVRKKANLSLLKLGIIYGANASGKSNLLKALDYLKNLILNRPKDKTTLINTPQFAFDPTYKNRPTSFYLSFFIGPTRYVYSLSLNTEVVLEEKLIFYPSIQPALAFERVYDPKEDKAHIEFGDRSSLNMRERLILEGSILRNSTVLAAYHDTNVSSIILKEVINWFKNYLHPTIHSNTNLAYQTKRLVARNEHFKQFMLEVLKKADFNINDIEIRENEKLSRELIYYGSAYDYDDDKIDRLVDQSKETFFIHNTNSGSYELSFNVQSEGTKRFYGLSSLLYFLRRGNAIAPIDELESSLHYELINHFLHTFLVNATESQLICTTHNVQILAEDFLRRDVVWFTEKQADGSTDLFAYTDVKLHKNISPYNAYRIGKIGAKPELGEIYLD